VKITEEQESGYSEEAGLAAFTLVQFDANRVGMVLRLFPGMVVVSGRRQFAHILLLESLA
jgi:hypothetical protein